MNIELLLLIAGGILSPSIVILTTGELTNSENDKTHTVLIVLFLISVVAVGGILYFDVLRKFVTLFVGLGASSLAFKMSLEWSHIRRDEW